MADDEREEAPQVVDRVETSGLDGSIERRPLTVMDASNSDETSVEPLAEIWKKLRRDRPGDGPDAAVMVEMLNRLKAERIAKYPKNVGHAETLPPNRYLDDINLDSRPADQQSEVAVQNTSDIENLIMLAHREEMKQIDAKRELAVETLRQAARNIDSIAADLDAVGFSDDADALFERARAIRETARNANQQKWDVLSRMVSLTYNVHALRAQLSAYALEHGGKYPQVRVDENGRRTLPQLLSKTNAEGVIGVGDEFLLGPYLHAMPANELWDWDDPSGIDEVKDWPPRGGERKSGWLYHPASGTIVPNLRELKQTRGINPTF